MKIETFCKRTGWPIEEFLQLKVFTEVIPLLALYGLRLRLVELPKKRRPKHSAFCNRCAYRGCLLHSCHPGCRP
jgi:hypothetical protein